MPNMMYAVGQPFQSQTHLEGDMYGTATTPVLSSGNQAGGLGSSHPVTNLSDEHLVKSLRTSDFTQLRVTYNLPGDPVGVLIEGLNFNGNDVKVESGSGTALGTDRGTVTPIQNKRTGRYGLFTELSGSGNYWGFEVDAGSSGDLVASAAYTSGWEVGRVTWFQSLNTMSQNWQTPLGQATGYEGAQRVLAGGKLDSTSTSQAYNVLSFGAEFDRNKGDNILDDIGAMSRCSPSDRYFVWFNNGDVSEAYLCAKTDFSADIDEFPTISVDLGLREAI